MTNDLTFWNLFAAALVLFAACAAVGGLLFALVKAVA